jgi:hypothetical protein
MKSISFSDAMILAILDGRKTVTRRLMKSQPLGEVKEIDGLWCETFYFFSRPDCPPDCDAIPIKPRYKEGETVYVKEAWAFYDPLYDDDKAEAFRIAAMVDPLRIIYRATSPDYLQRRWRSPRFMPEWASRLKITFIGVRAERIQDITENDSVEEGANGPVPTIQGGEIGESGPPSFVHGFREIWESLYPGSWDKNEWVWRYEFKKG